MLNPAERGWFRQFLRRQTRAGLTATPEKSQASESSTEIQRYLYERLQPTGLMYGFPVRFLGPAPKEAPTWTEKAKIKYLLAESFLAVGAYYHAPTPGNVRQRIPVILAEIEQFYEDHGALIPAGARKRWRRRDDIRDRVEGIFDQRVSLRYDWRNFWNSFFHNSLLFFDLIDFLLWKEQLAPAEHQSLLMRRQSLRFDILKVIAAAAHADGRVSLAERELFQYFLHSAKLPAHRKQQAEAFFRDGMALGDMELEDLDTWLLKKYFLELAILTTWTNREISAAEHRFLQTFSYQIGLTAEDLSHSMENIRTFVLQYWDQVHYLAFRQNYRIVSEQLLRRLRNIARSNQQLLLREIRGSRELATLISRYPSGELTAREKEQLRVGLLDILKAIPAYSYFLLPFSFFTLPIIFRILPKSLLFPYSYREEQREEADDRQDTRQHSAAD